MFIAARVLFILALLTCGMTFFGFVRIAWKHHRWVKSGRVESFNLVNPLVVCMALTGATIIVGVLGCKCAKAHVETWAAITRKTGLSVNVNDRPGLHRGLLDALTQLQSNPADHRSDVGARSTCHISSGERSLTLFLFQKTPESHSYTVKVCVFGVSELGSVNVGRIEMNSEIMNPDWTDKFRSGGIR